MIKRHLPFAATLLATSTALFAQGLPADARPTTRAEVLADLSLYERSGLQSLDDRGGDRGTDVFSSRYRQAVAEYRRLRSSPEYAASVQRFAAKLGEPAPDSPAAAR